MVGEECEVLRAVCFSGSLARFPAPPSLCCLWILTPVLPVKVPELWQGRPDVMTPSVHPGNLVGPGRAFRQPPSPSPSAFSAPGFAFRVYFISQRIKNPHLAVLL